MHTSATKTVRNRTVKGAVIGSSRAGKSAFINSFCNIFNNPEKQAPESKSTDSDIFYESEDYFVGLSEIPDPNSIVFPTLRFFSKFDFKQYDFFVLLVGSRLQQEIELLQWIFQYIRGKFKKPCFLVRPMMDLVVAKQAMALNYQVPYSLLDETQKVIVTKAAYAKLKEKFHVEFPGQRVYFIGRDTTGARHTYEFAGLWSAILPNPVLRSIPSTVQQTNQQELPEKNKYEKLWEEVKEMMESLNPVARQETGESTAEYLNKIEKMIGDGNVIVNGAVTGISGAGKSAFINSFTNSQIAKEGIIQTTMKETAYLSPDGCVRMTDLPGVGTTEFRKGQYSTNFKLSTYDFIVLMIGKEESIQAQELNKWILNHVQKVLKKPCYLVQSFVDEDIEEEVRKIAPTSVEQLQLAKKRVYRKLKSKYPSEKLFLIGRDPTDPMFPRHSYQFPKLMESISDDLPQHKQRVMVASTDIFTDNWLKKKEQLLDDCIIRYSFVSSAAAACPVPGPSIAVDSMLLGVFALQCKKVFGLDEENLRSVILSPRMVASFVTRIAALIASITTTVLVANSVDDAVKVVPVVGMFVGMGAGAAISGPLMYFYLGKMRDDLKGILKEVLQARAMQVAAWVLEN